MADAATSRRQFLKVSGKGLVAFGLGGTLARFSAYSSYAAGEDYRALVCVFLFGGNDGNNLLIPLDSAGWNAYQRARGSLALPQGQLQRIGTRAGRDFGLHPNLSRLRQRYQSGRLALVANMGMLVRPVTRAQIEQDTGELPRQLMSHEDQIRQMQAGVTVDSLSGWGGRAIDQILALNGTSTFPPSLSLNGESLFCVGETAQTAGLGGGSNLDLRALDPPDPQDRDLRRGAHQEILKMDSGMRLVQESNGTLQKAKDLQQMLDSATDGVVLQTVFPDTGIGQQLAEVARFIQLRDQLGIKRQVFFCGLGGFDTHSDQIPSQGGLMAQLDAALDAFYLATEELSVADKVTTFTESDFGRTLNPSGNGSDHAWGSHHLVLGAAVRGTDLYGKFPTLQLRGPDDLGDRGVWIPTTALDQYGATLARWFGVPDAALDRVFPNLANFAVRDLGFMG